MVTLESLKSKLIVVLLIIIVLLGLNLTYKGCSSGKGTPMPTLPENAISRVTVAKEGISIEEKKGTIHKIPLPKTDKVIVITDKDGSVSIEKSSWMPELVCLPQMGISLSRTLEPQLGLQFLRSEPFGLGVSLGITPTILSLNLDKDVLSNSYIGLFVGYDKDLHNTIGFRFGLFF